MANGKPLTTYALVGNSWCYLFNPIQSSRVLDGFDIVRQNYYTLRVQAVRSIDPSLNSTGQASSGTVDLSNYSDVIFGLKAEATDTDYAAAWRGFNTTDSWHSLANGRFSIDIAATTAVDVQQYRGCAFRLINGTQYLDIPDLPLIVNLRQNAITGSEPSTPSGSLTANSGSAVITAGQTSKVVTFSGMTASGVVIVSLLNVSELTTVSVTPASGQFTINIGATYGSDVTAAYFVAQL